MKNELRIRSSVRIKLPDTVEISTTVEPDDAELYRQAIEISLADAAKNGFVRTVLSDHSEKILRELVRRQVAR